MITCRHCFRRTQLILTKFNRDSVECWVCNTSPWYHCSNIEKNEASDSPHTVACAEVSDSPHTVARAVASDSPHTVTRAEASDSPHIVFHK